MERKESKLNIINNIHSDNNTTSIGSSDIIYNFVPIVEKITCTKCSKIFTSQQTLKTHLLTTNCVKKNINITNECLFCKKEFSSKQMLIYHDNICIHKKLNILIIDYESKIKDLEEQILHLKIPS